MFDQLVEIFAAPTLVQELERDASNKSIVKLGSINRTELELSDQFLSIIHR
jgi:hypothetical protein